MLEKRARDWIATDPDPQTRRQGQALLDGGDAAALADHFGSRLQFGTAGMRGPLGPGPNRMNRRLVRQVTAGLAAYLLRTVADAASRGVVVGFDGRHGSAAFAADAAAVLGAAGLRVWTYDDVVPTPELAHAVVGLKAAAGIMVTASHNPPADNGYKVYWSNGAQIVPPHDKGISAAIDEAGHDCPEAAGVPRVPAQLRSDYLDGVEALRVHRNRGARVVYTAMHGVGRARIEEVLRRAGHEDLHVVAAQADPDPDFPTVAFPNPEEPGALDLAYALAREVGADVVIANDPDADRLAVALPQGDGFLRLSGNQVGVLLAEDLLTHGEGGAERLVATTVVSTAMLRRIAAHHGVAYAETLTGFKWIANRAIEHDADGGRFVVGFEEALGYSVGGLVRDKDGVSAALLIADMVAWCKDQGRTLLDLLDDLYRLHGVHVSGLHSVTLPGASGRTRIEAVMRALRADPPRTIAGSPVVAVRDFSDGSIPELPRSNVLAFELEDGGRVLARPSGTEPKIKLYFEARRGVPAGESVAEARAAAEEVVEQMRAELVERTGL